MKVKLSPKNPRIVLDENNDQLFEFTGLHIDDLRRIVKAINSFERGYNYDAHSI